MGTKYKNRNTTGLTSAILTGLLVAAAIMILCAAITALLVVNESIAESSAEYVIPLVQLLSVFAGSFIAGKRAGGNQITASAVTSVIYYIFLAAMTILFFGGIFRNMATGTVTVVVGAASAVIVNLRQKNNMSGRKRRTHAR